jgi:hypothetical protein
MFDSAQLSDVPADAEMVAWYPHTWGGDISRFKDAAAKEQIVRIDNQGNHADDCSILDIESGAASQSIAKAWLVEHHRHTGDIATIYCNRSTLSGVLEAIGDTPHHLWIADPNGDPHAYPGADATQYAWPGIGSPGQYDLSLVTNDKWCPVKNRK